jgi:hypothetical protein
MHKSWAVVGLVLVAGAARADLLIDNFSDGNYSVSLAANNQEDVRAASAIGGFRRTYLQINQNPIGTNNATLAIGGSYFSFGADPLVNAIAETSYGLGANGTFNDLNLNLSGDTEFRLSFQSNDLATNQFFIAIGTRPSGGGSSSQLISLPAGMVNTSFVVVVPFSSFTGNASFSDVDNITIRFLNPGSGDVLLKQVATAVPEPATLLVLGGGLAVAAWKRRRRNA